MKPKLPREAVEVLWHGDLKVQPRINIARKRNNGDWHLHSYKKVTSASYTRFLTLVTAKFNKPALTHADIWAFIRIWKFEG